MNSKKGKTSQCACTFDRFGISRPCVAHRRTQQHVNEAVRKQARKEAFKEAAIIVGCLPTREVRDSSRYTTATRFQAKAVAALKQASEILAEVADYQGEM